MISALLAELPGLSPQDGLARARRKGDPREVLLAACDEAEKHVMVDLPRSLGLLRLLTVIADESGDGAARARTRRGLAQALAYANRFEEALVLLGRAVGIAESGGDALEAARSRMTTLHALARLGRYTEALEVGTRALSAFVAAEEPLLAARARINLGVTCRMSDEPGLALAHFDRALPALDHEPVLRAQLESNRAEALLDLNDFRNAESAFEAALDSFRAAKQSRAAAIVEGNIADLQSRQGRVHSALVHFERARRQLGELDAPGDVARLGVEQAEALMSIGLASDAGDALRAAIPVLREHKMVAETARALVALSRAMIELSHDHETRPLLAEARDLFGGLGHATGTARVEILESQVAASAGDFATARSSLHRAVEALVGRPAEQAAARARLAWVALQSGRLTEAEGEVERCLSVASALDLAPLRSRALHLRALCHREQGKWAPALADFNEAVAQVERLRGLFQSDRFRTAFLGDQTLLYQDAIIATLGAAGPNAVREAFTIVERSKGRSLLEQMQSGHATTSSEPEPVDDEPEAALVRTSSRLRNELHALYAQIDGLSAPSARIPDDSWNRAVRERERELRELELRLASTARYGLVFSEPIPMNDACAMIGPGAGLVEFFEECGWISAFVLTSEGVLVFRRLLSRTDAAELVESLHFQLNRAIVRGLPSGAVGDRLTADTNCVLGQLGEALLAPTWGTLRGVERLVAVPHGVLHRVPFHALMIDGKHLIDHAEVSIAPSVSVLASMGNRLSAGTGGLVVGVSDERIPGAESEATVVGASLAGSVVLRGSGATVGAVRELAPGRGVVHLATHARFIPSTPQASGVRLADGWLTAHDAARMRLDGAAVVLSGCNTGQSAVFAGDELMGLARAFLLAGASSLIMSLWTLHDQSALEIMASLYSLWYPHCGRASNPGAALREAQREVRCRRPHPAAWAPIVAMTPIGPSAAASRANVACANRSTPMS